MCRSDAFDAVATGGDSGGCGGGDGGGITHGDCFVYPVVGLKFLT